MRLRCWLTVVVASLALAACGTAQAQRRVTVATVPSAMAPVAGAPSASAGGERISKVLVVVEENHSLSEMHTGMPYLDGLAQRYAYATRYSATTHPSLPNYLAISGGSTSGVSDDRPPTAHPVHGPSVFGAAVAAGGSARLYAEAMTAPCMTTDAGRYAVKHNPWAYYVDERAACATGDVPLGPAGSGALARDAAAGRLPNAGMAVPDLDHDAHDGTLAAADSWLHARLPAVLGGPDFTSGRLVVVVTADEDDRSAGNAVLTVVLHAGLDGAHKVVTAPLDHDSLTRLYGQVSHTPPLRGGASAPDLAAAFGLPIG